MPEDYFSHPRPEVRALVPQSARSVVDVGCGAGALGAALKEERPGTEVRGIEVNPEAAARAACVLDEVAVVSGDGEVPASWPAVDCVIFADVLEHMVDPWSALRRWRSRLRGGGHVVVSLPNVGHWSVLDELARGRWDYVDEGVLDRTHVRFFTRATAIELLETTGFEVETMRRAIQLRVDAFLGEKFMWPLVLLGIFLERKGRRVPAWLVRILDVRSRQILLRARMEPAPQVPSPHA